MYVFISQYFMKPYKQIRNEDIICVVKHTRFDSYVVYMNNNIISRPLLSLYNGQKLSESLTIEQSPELGLQIRV